MVVHKKINPEEVDAKITTHKGDASAHHPVHVKTLEDHPLSIIPAIPPDQLSAIDSPADGEAPTYNAAEGKFEWKVAAGVTKLSELIIDVNKDWAGKVIKNVGAPVDPTDVLRLTDLTAHIGVADAHHAVHLKTLADHPLSIIPAITPGKLDAIDSPGDGEVPTYNLAQGKFEWKAMVGISSLSELVIDVSKDWGGYVIKNLGAPVDAGDVYSKGNVIDLADIPTITYAKLSIANSLLVSDILSTEFNVANKLLKLDASALVPLAQVPPITPGKLDAIDSPADGEVPAYNVAQGKFEWKSMVGISSLSELIIDVSKDWAGYKIKNLGAPVDAGDAYSKGNVIDVADIPDVETLNYTGPFAVAQIPTISIAKISDIPGTIASILTDHNLAQHHALFPGIDSAGKLVLTQIGTKVADLATLWTKATKITYGDLDVADDLLTSDIKSTEFNVANKLLKLDASALVPIAQIPPITPGKLDAIDSPADGESPTYNLAQDKFEWKTAVGVSKLSELEIDVSKDWAGYKIKNLGAPVDAGDAYSKGNVINLADIPTGLKYRVPDYTIVKIGAYYYAIDRDGSLNYQNANGLTTLANAIGDLTLGGYIVVLDPIDFSSSTLVIDKRIILEMPATGEGKGYDVEPLIYFQYSGTGDTVRITDDGSGTQFRNVSILAAGGAQTSSSAVGLALKGNVHKCDFYNLNIKWFRAGIGAYIYSENADKYCSYNSFYKPRFRANKIGFKLGKVGVGKNTQVTLIQGGYIYGYSEAERADKAVLHEKCDFNTVFGTLIAHADYGLYYNYSNRETALMPKFEQVGVALKLHANAGGLHDFIAPVFHSSVTTAIEYDNLGQIRTYIGPREKNQSLIIMDSCIYEDTVDGGRMVIGAKGDNFQILMEDLSERILTVNDAGIFAPNPLYIDTIYEKSSGVGVTLDGVQLKDGHVRYDRTMLGGSTGDEYTDTTTEKYYYLAGISKKLGAWFNTMMVPKSGRMRNLHVYLSSAPGVGKSYTFTLWLNGSLTSLTVTISGTAKSGSDTVHVVSVSPGQEVALKCTPSGTPAAVIPKWGLIYEADI